MAFTGVHIVCGFTVDDVSKRPLLIDDAWSETFTVGTSGLTAQASPSSSRPPNQGPVFHILADRDIYVQRVTMSGAVITARRAVLAGDYYDYAAGPGEKLSWENAT